MGTTSYLTTGSTGGFGNLIQEIENLRDLSILFVRRWERKELDRAGKVSADAMKIFDYVVGELMRARDDQKSSGIYATSRLRVAMEKQTGLMAHPVTSAEQYEVGARGPGAGKLPMREGKPLEINLEKTLNKLKHRNGGIVNFRIESGRHIFVICPTRMGGGADSIVEFDVDDFCSNSLDAARSLS
jgi:hypothetical protein